jgi:hypothetical protein
VGPSPLTSRHQAVDDLRGRLHARYDAALEAVGTRFSVGVARRPTSSGLTRVAFLHVWPESGMDDAEWPLDTRQWTGAMTQHHTLDEVEAEIGAVLTRYAAREAGPS